MKKYIILALVTILAAVLFVACDSDVKFNNDVAYTEILETDGAFVFNGKNYESLQDAINAAAKAKSLAPAKITLSRDVVSRPIVIPAGAAIELDLGGYGISFVDVEENAITVEGDSSNLKGGIGGNTYLILSNGTLSLKDETKNLSVVNVKSSFVDFVDAMVLAAEGQFGIYAEDDANITLESKSDDGASISGLVYVGENSFLTLHQDSVIDGIVYIFDSSLVLNGSSSVLENVIAVDSKVYLNKKACIFGDVLLSAIEDYAKLFTDENTEIVGTITAEGKAVGAPNSLDLELNNIINNLSLTNGRLYVGSTGHVTLIAVDGNNEYTAAEGGSAITTPEGVVIDVKDGICYIERGEEGKKTRTYFSSLREAVAEAQAKDVIVYLNNDTQDYSEGITVKTVVGVELNGHNFGHETKTAEFIVEKGAILAVADTATINGIGKKVFKANVSGAGSFYVANVVVSGTVEIGEDFKSKDAILNGTIKAGTVMDGDDLPQETVKGSTFYADIETTTGVAVFDNSIFESVSIKSADEVAIYNSTGRITDITAAKDVTIDNSADGYNSLDVYTIKGVDVKVYGSLDDFDSLTVTIGSVNASSLTAGSTAKIGAKFADTITATESVTLNHSFVLPLLASLDYDICPSIYAPVITISNSELHVNEMMKSHVENEDPVPATSVSVTLSTGTIGTIVASNSDTAKNGITLSTPTSEDGHLTVGTLNAGGDDIQITGNNSSDNNLVIVYGNVTVGKLTASYAKFHDDVTASVSASFTNSYLGDGVYVDVYAPVITISNSELYVNEMMKSHVENEAPVPATSVSVTSSKGYIESIVASNSDTAKNGITLSTPTSTSGDASLIVGTLDAGEDDIQITGNHSSYAKYVIVDGDVAVGKLTANYAKFYGDVTATGLIDISNCAIGPEYGASSGITVTTDSPDDGDTKAIRMTNVEFVRSAVSNEPASYVYADVKAEKGGSIEMTGCTGYAGNITATNKAGSAPGTITIDNSADGSEPLTTLALTAADDDETSTKFGNISVYGLANDTVTVNGSVTGATVTAGDSANSVKKGADFNGGITASVAVNLYNSFVGDGVDDDVFAPQITIADSHLYVDELKGVNGAAEFVSVTSSTGSIGTIVASNSDTAKNGITLSTPTSTSGDASLIVGTLNAGKDDIQITGNHSSYAKYVIVNGDVTVGKLTASYAQFYGNVTATGLIDISNGAIGPEYEASSGITVKTDSLDDGDTKAIQMTNVHFVYRVVPNSASYVYADVKAEKGGSIEMIGCTGVAGTITATNDDTAESVGSVVIDNSELTGIAKLETKAINSSIGAAVFGSVTLTGHDSAEYLNVASVVGNVLDFDYVYVSNSVAAHANDSSSKGYVYSTRSTFNDNVIADYIIDGKKDLGIAGSTFERYVEASVKANFWGSSVGCNTDVVSDIVFIENSAVNIEDIFGDYGTGYAPIPATRVSVISSTGSIGTIFASNSDTAENGITLSTPNSTSGAVSLTVGTLNAGEDDIQITGNHQNSYDNFVIVSGDVTVGKLTASYAKFYGDVTASGFISVKDSLVGNEGNYEITTIWSTAEDSIDKSAIAMSNVMFVPGYVNQNYYYANLVATNGGVSIEHATGNLGRIVTNDLSISDVDFTVAGYDIFLEPVAVNANGTVTIDSGVYNGSVVISGNGYSTITGGTFNGATSFTSGTGELNSSGSYANLYFANILSLSGDWEIRNASFKASSVAQLNIIGTHISQYNANDLVSILYKGNLDGGTAIVRSSSSIERIMLRFGENTTAYSTLTGSKTTLIFGQFVEVEGNIYAPAGDPSDPVLVAVGRSLYGCVFKDATLQNLAPMKDVGNECWYRNTDW